MGNSSYPSFPIGNSRFTCSGVFIIDFEQKNICYAKINYYNVIKYHLTSSLWVLVYNVASANYHRSLKQKEDILCTKNRVFY